MLAGSHRTRTIQAEYVPFIMAMARRGPRVGTRSAGDGPALAPIMSMRFRNDIDPGGGRCPVCSTSISEGGVRCSRCDVPHHEDCWDYSGGCAVYGCHEPAGGRAAVAGTMGTSELRMHVRFLLWMFLLVVGFARLAPPEHVAILARWTCQQNAARACPPPLPSGFFGRGSRPIRIPWIEGEDVPIQGGHPRQLGVPSVQESQASR